MPCPSSSRKTTLHRTPWGRVTRGANRSRRLRRRISGRSRLVLRRAFRLHLLRCETSITLEAALNQRLRLINKRIRQRIASYVTHRKLLPFAIEHKIHTALRPVNASGLNGSANANPVRPGIALQRRQLGNRVVVRLALAIAQPRQKAHRRDDYADPDAEFGLFFHAMNSGSDSRLVPARRRV